MTEQTRETLQELQEILRYGAEKRLELNPHGEAAYTEHSIANDIRLALAATPPSPSGLDDLWDGEI